MRRMLNTMFSAVVLMAWLWKFFGPGGAEARRAGSSMLSGMGTSLGGLMWISIAVVCLGYLLWRFMSRLFWHKYFHEDPPDEDE